MSKTCFFTSQMNPTQFLQKALQKAIFLDHSFDHIVIFIAFFQVAPFFMHQK